nr:MAG TPA: hypothetical protein [Caudoviricetes sp.]
MGLYAKNAKLYAAEDMEFYIPMSYFEKNRYATNMGEYVETIGIIYAKTNDGDYRLFTVPATIKLYVYTMREDEIEINGSHMNVYALEYVKDSYVMEQSIVRGIAIASKFVNLILGGKLPSAISYDDLISIWWKNLEIAGFTLQTPSKIMELILAEIYRSPNNKKQRFGQLYGSKDDVSPYAYKTGNVRDVVMELSTYSGIIFEDMGRAISNGINNSVDGIDEPISPLEKIIHY